MLYDTRWDRRFEEPPPRGNGWFWFFVAAFVPVLIGAYTLATAFDSLTLLAAPLGVNLAAIVWARFAGW
ncbi:hypothetical protein GCM10011390_36280 [Aureimonas endophytica]|uniref:Uncharacterized protein n=1 Tax=Aureimonas endophytica TaxID=2027858 RepID=A0A917E8K4_9HYPH|nr:hypothetical protein [Aureimonas endophytica]GGE13886.1 hypothetical protein GCM10011390_36280 [Aureimonas endophytica]